MLCVEGLAITACPVMEVTALVTGSVVMATFTLIPASFSAKPKYCSYSFSEKIFVGTLVSESPISFRAEAVYPINAGTAVDTCATEGGKVGISVV